MLTYNIPYNEIIIKYRKRESRLLMLRAIVYFAFPKVIEASHFWVWLGRIYSNALFLPV